MTTKILLLALCIIGIVALVVLIRDNPKYADGEPVAIVKEWLLKDEVVDYIKVLPSTATIAAGANQSYSAEAFNQYRISLGDITPSTAFSIKSRAGGSWLGNVYTSETTGSWIVTGTYNDKSDDASLTVKSSTTDKEMEDEEMEYIVETWDEEYLGHGKWVVTCQKSIKSKEDYSSFAEFWEEQQESYTVRLREYTSDLPLDDRLSFLDGLWEPTSRGLLILTEPDQEWYVYEETGLVIDKAAE